MQTDLSIQLAGPNCASVAFTLAATVPVGAQASVVLPAMNGTDAASLVVIEGGKTVWAAGAFVPGVPGITAASVSAQGVAFTVGSGKYAFVSLAK